MDFRKVLSTKVDEIKRPPLIPVGTYRARVSKPVQFDEIGNGKWKVADFMLQLVEPQMDVNQDDLAAYGGLTANSVMQHRFMFSTEDTPEAKANVERTVFNMKRFLVDHLGIKDATDLNEAAMNAMGQECLVHVTWRPDPNDAEIQYNQIKKTLPLPT